VDGISESKLQICIEPRSQKLVPGSTLVLQCVAIGSPIPHYQWFKNESPLTHETKKLYMVGSQFGELSKTGGKIKT
jgi:mucosa-associated lymphoid tissue lymphoma translocation protein 1